MARAKPQGVANNDAPTPDGTSEPIVIPTAILERFDDVEENVSKIKDRLGVVNNTNNLIVMVLFVLVVAIVIAAIYGFTAAIKSDSESRDKLTQSVNDLRVQTEVQNQLQKNSSPTTSTTSP